jgi:chromate transporter
MMEEEVVRRRQWLDHETFLDLLGTCNLLPGPNSTELAIYIGYARAGWRGLLLAGLCFIVPAALLTLGFAALYMHFGRLPTAQGFLLGIKPVVLAIVAQAVWNLGRMAIKTWRSAILGVAVLAASCFGIQEALLILGAGAISLLLTRPRLALPAAGFGWLPALPALALPFSLGGLFWVFLKVGATLFGSGYVLIAYLRTDLVHRLGWLTETQLLDAVAVGQVTPGPVFTTATFIGYLLGSWRGALVATLGIFLPAFLLVGLSGFFLPRLRKSPALAAFMNGVNAAAVALMATALWDLGRATLASPWTLTLGLAAAWLLIRHRVNATWVLLGGGLTGYLLHLAG